MDNVMTEEKLSEHTILCVDDEENILHSLKRLLRKEGYNILTATSAKEGLRLLEEEDIHLVISDHRMPEMSGATFLSKVREMWPNVIRIILTGYTDVDSIADSINKGHIYKIFLKPWNNESLKLEIKQILEQYDLITTNKNLNEKIMAQNMELNKINDNLESLVEERTKNLEIHNQALQISHAILDELPVPIIGVGGDGMVTIMNREGELLFQGENQLVVGSNIYNYYPGEIKEGIESALSDYSRKDVSCCSISDKNYSVIIKPLTDKFLGKGVILTFRDCRC